MSTASVAQTTEGSTVLPGPGDYNSMRNLSMGGSKYSIRRVKGRTMRIKTETESSAFKSTTGRSID